MASGRNSQAAHSNTPDPAAGPAVLRGSVAGPARKRLFSRRLARPPRSPPPWGALHSEFPGRRGSVLPCLPPRRTAAQHPRSPSGIRRRMQTQPARFQAPAARTAAAGSPPWRSAPVAVGLRLQRRRFLPRGDFLPCEGFYLPAGSPQLPPRGLSRGATPCSPWIAVAPARCGIQGSSASEPRPGARSPPQRA